MIFILYGEETYLVEDKLKEIIKTNKNAYLTKFDASNKSFDINNILDACTSTSLFNESSIVLVKDPYFLINKVEIDQIEGLMNYIDNPSYENTLIFYTLENKFNTRLKVFKDISLNADVMNFEKLTKDNFYNYCKNIIIHTDLKISKDAIYYLINNCNYDLNLFKSNLEILTLFPENIDLDVIKNLMTYPSEEEIFSLINAITVKDISLSIKYANKLFKQGESILSIIAALGSQLRFLYQVSYLKEKGNSVSNIAKTTGYKEFRITKAFESLNNINSKEILILLSKLCDLDYKCKKEADLSDKLNLELLIVSLIGDKK